MLDGQIDHEITDILARHPRASTRRAPTRPRTEPAEQTRPLDAAEIWRAPLHLGFSFGLFMATRVMGVR